MPSKLKSLITKIDSRSLEVEGGAARPIGLVVTQISRYPHGGASYGTLGLFGSQVALLASRRVDSCAVHDASIVAA